MDRRAPWHAFVCRERLDDELAQLKAQKDALNKQVYEGESAISRGIDDLEGKTLASASSLEKDVRGAIEGMNKTDVAKKVGTLLGERAKKAGVSKVSFDRGTYKYHGRVKALADGAREAGLEF